MSIAKRFVVWSARLNEVLLGLVLLLGALLKSGNINLFIVQISYYGVLHAPHWLEAAALATLAIETGLGMALVFGLRFRGLTYAAVLALLAAFTGLILYGWIFHGLKDCGCFGPIEVSPEVSIAKNAVFAVMAAGAWLGYRWSRIEAGSRRRWMPAMGATVVAAVALPAYSWFDMEPPTDPERPFAQFTLFAEETGEVDFGTGEYFIAMLNMTCEHCMEAVERLNELAAEPGFPPVVGICFEERPGALDEFRAQTGAQIPLYSLGDRVRAFFSLVGDAGPPRFYLIRDGRPLKYWDETAPDPEEVYEAQGASAPESRGRHGPLIRTARS